MTKAKSTDESPSSAVKDELMDGHVKEENIKVDQSNQLDKSFLLNQSNNEEKELDSFSGFGFSHLEIEHLIIPLENQADNLQSAIAVLC